MNGHMSGVVDVLNNKSGDINFDTEALKQAIVFQLLMTITPSDIFVENKWGPNFQELVERYKTFVEEGSSSRYVVQTSFRSFFRSVSSFVGFDFPVSCFHAH